MAHQSLPKPRNRMVLRRAAFSMAAACLAAYHAITPVAASTVAYINEIAPSIRACWHPPAGEGEITLRMSFRRDGTLLGRPRITHVHSADGPDGEAALANSIFAAISACSPRFTPELGAAIAGRVFTIRFIAARSYRAAL